MDQEANKGSPSQPLIGTPPQEQLARRCPRGHIMIPRTDVDGYCDICYCNLVAGEDAILYCKECRGFCVCQDCREKSNQPNPYVTAEKTHEKGVKLFLEKNFVESVECFQKSLELREFLMGKEPTGTVSYYFAENAGILAKALFLAGNEDDAMRMSEIAISHFKTAKYQLAKEWLVWAQQLQRDIQLLMSSTEVTGTGGPTNSIPKNLEVPGVSVHHLQTTLMARVRIASLNLRMASIHAIEDLQGPPGIIRQTSGRAICPNDWRQGAAYVHCLSGEDHVGEATHLLSYSWSYTMGDVVDTLLEFCLTNKLDPKRTYIWIDCLCINQHRVVEQKLAGGTGLLNFEEEFPAKLKRIGHMLAMMAPWKAPVYLTRIWCIYELFVAHSRTCKVDIVMPPKEKASLRKDLLADQGGIDVLYKALGKTMVQNAQASFEGDRQAILALIDSTVGFKVLNNQVNERLRNWAKDVLTLLVETQEDTNDKNYSDFCFRIGTILWRNGEHHGALQQYQKCLQIREAALGIDHPDTASTYSHIGLVLTEKKDYDGALEHFQKCLVTYKNVFGTDHQYTARAHINVGNALKAKGDYDGALEQCFQCLGIQKSAIGDDHLDTAITYGNIGCVMELQGDFEGALENFQKCLAIQEAGLGKNHPHTATTYNNLGSALKAKGDFDAALDQYRKCLDTYEHVLGINHPHTATTYSCIGSLLSDQGDYGSALEHFMKCLHIRKSILGEDHPGVATTHGRIGSLLQRQGDYDGSLEQYHKCLSIQSAVFGMDHPDTSTTKKNIESVLKAKGA